MQDHLAKPIAIERLGPCLERWLVTKAPAAPVASRTVPSEEDEARQMYEQRKARLRDQLAEIDTSQVPGTEQSGHLRDQLHVMAGIAVHFGDAELGDLARKTERELKLNTDDGALAAAIDELQTWFER